MKQPLVEGPVIGATEVLQGDLFMLGIWKRSKEWKEGEEDNLKGKNKLQQDERNSSSRRVQQEYPDFRHKSLSHPAWKEVHGGPWLVSTDGKGQCTDAHRASGGKQESATTLTRMLEGGTVVLCRCHRKKQR